jgi:hypothetical protein
MAITGMTGHGIIAGQSLMAIGFKGSSVQQSRFSLELLNL